jgi:hypothetical protein
MAIEDDFEIYLNGDIRYIGGGSTRYTVLELHRYLQAKADDAQMSGDDLLDITSADPSSRSTDNIITLNSPFNIDDDAAEQLYNGSITQDDGDTVYSGLRVVGTVETGTELIVIRDGKIVTSWWGTGINADPANNIISQMLIRTRGGTNGTDDFTGCDIDGKKLTIMAREFNDKYAEFQLTAGLGNSVAAIFTVPDLNNTTPAGTITGWGTPPANDNEGYNLIDLNNGNGPQPYYSKWDKNAYSINQLYEYTKYVQRRGTAETTYGISGALFRGITHQYDYDNETGAMTQSEILAWGTSFPYTSCTGAFTLGERVNFSPSGAVGQLIYDDGGGGATGTAVVYLDPNSATPTSSDTMTGASSTESCDVGTVTGSTAAGGTGLLLADDGTDTVWFQLLTGSPPVDPLFVFGITSENSHQVNGTVTSRTVTAEAFGQSTGTAIIGSFGIGVEAADLATADKLTDLLNTPQSPPNNQTFTVSGLVAGEDRVLVAANDGSNKMDYNQYALQTTLNSGGQTAVVVTGAVEAYTPQQGWLRVQLDLNKSGDLGIYRIVAYTSWSTSGNTTFVTASTDWTDPDDATAGNNVFVGLIDKTADASTATFTGVYSSDKSLLGRVRDGGGTPTKPLDYVVSFTSGGGGFSAIRTPDT